MEYILLGKKRIMLFDCHHLGYVLGMSVSKGMQTSKAKTFTSI